MSKKIDAEIRKAGFEPTTVQDLFELSDKQVELIDGKIALGKLLKETRKKKRVSQTALAKAMGSDQSNISRLEAGDTNLTFDILYRSLLAIGLSNKEIGKSLSKA